MDGAATGGEGKRSPANLSPSGAWRADAGLDGVPVRVAWEASRGAHNGTSQEERVVTAVGRPSGRCFRCKGDSETAVGVSECRQASWRAAADRNISERRA